ncbi:carboxypeptidase-like regulatory domain-containing protein [Vulgatibacter incomptus]|uniref:Carboxypeptidase regulatory-like domain-containing protein n=1 Tax=Vulgatibacter incomptus TaxID=1391653 RepID=A0A0K1PID2_9BACT|nr:carboxypeptidase-like regulatory domain-containing protein [Vulgatibacter incomptus]AKU93298.1 hypothetical protein AKJ08_3685 [Vulgatibacter incomptus]
MSSIRPRDLLVPLPLLVALLACGSDPRPTCDVVPRQDGTRLLICSDGTSTVLPKLPTEKPGCTVVGEAKLFGRSNHAAITVTLADTASGAKVEARPSQDGTYVFPALTSGVYDLTFEAPGYNSEKLGQLVVAPGAFRVDPVELRMGKKLTDSPAARLVPSPDYDAFVAMGESDPGPATLWEEDGWWSKPLGGDVARLSFSPSGRRLTFLNDSRGANGPGTLYHYDRDAGALSKVDTLVREWILARDEASIVALQEGSRLLYWTTNMREDALVISEGVLGWWADPELRTVVFRIGTGELIVWDLAAGGGATIGSGSGPITFSPDGRSFVFTALDRAMLWDGARNEVVPLAAPTANGAIFSPNGNWVLLRKPGLDQVLFDLESGRQDLLRSVFWAHFSSSSDALFYVAPNDSGAVVLTRWSLPDLRSESIEGIERMPPPRVVPAPGGEALLFRTNVSITWVPGTGSDFVGTLMGWRRDRGFEELARDVGSTWTPSPDGAFVSFVQGSVRVVKELESGDSWSVGEVLLPNAPAEWDPSSTVLRFGSGDIPLTHWAWDTERKEAVSLGDQVDSSNCRFAGDGSLACLARRSSNGGGSEIVRWDRPSNRVRVLTDGIWELDGSGQGSRLGLLSRPRIETKDGLLLVFDPQLPEPVAVDDEVELMLSTARWLAYSIGDDTSERPGLYVTDFPTTPVTR